MSDLEYFAKRLNSRRVWDDFVMSLFLKNFKIYAEKHGRDFNSLRDDVIETAEKVGEFVWKQRGNGGPTTDWEIAYIISSTHNHDNLNNLSPARIYNPDVRNLLRKIESKELYKDLERKAAIRFIQKKENPYSELKV